MEKLRQRVVPNSQLRDHRRQQNWTQAMVAEKLGVTEITVRRWERGQTTPSPYYTKKLCDLFQKTPEDLGLANVSTRAEMPVQDTSQLPSPIADQAQKASLFLERQPADLPLPIGSHQGTMQSGYTLFLQRQSRLVWAIISAVSLILVLSGSLFWIWRSDSVRSRRQTENTSRMSYYVCGDQAILTNINNWTTVPAGKVIHTSDYSGPANGYTGASGNPSRSARNCSGRYQWAWNQSPVQAMWVWSNAYLPHGKCHVDVHIPSWYAGSPDALYTLTIKSSTSSTSYMFDPQNQNQPATTWITLHIQNQVPSIPMPDSSNNIYTLTLILINGKTNNWYLGADAIRFDCSASL